jgi:peptide/nickel transport system permease protein
MTESAGAGSPAAALALPTSGGAVVWRRFRRDRVGVCALAGLALIALACFVVEPLLEVVLGHGPDEPFPSAVDPTNHRPVGWFSHVANNGPHGGRTLFLLGGDGPLGRDELLRLLAGGRVSLEIAVIATLLALVIGVVLGTAGGYFGGVLDGAISRVTELFMSFPLLLLVIALGQTAAHRFEDVTLAGLFPPGVVALSVVVGLFCWFYPARVTRTLVVSLREQEFVEAAQMVGATPARIIRRELLPHLTGPLIVWGTLVAAGVVVLEASLSVLNFGLRLGTSSWGSLLAQAWGTLLNYNPNFVEPNLRYPTPALLKAAPAGALFLTVLCLALVGDGLRSALDPRRER